MRLAFAVAILCVAAFFAECSIIVERASAVWTWLLARELDIGELADDAFFVGPFAFFNLNLEIARRFQTDDC